MHSAYPNVTPDAPESRGFGVNLTEPSKQDIACKAIVMAVAGKGWKTIARELMVTVPTLTSIRRKYGVDEAVKRHTEGVLDAAKGSLTVEQRIRLLVGIAANRKEEAHDRIAAIKAVTDILGDGAKDMDSPVLTTDRALRIILQLDKGPEPIEAMLEPKPEPVPLPPAAVEPKVEPKTETKSPTYVCPQCGPDSMGAEIHALTSHTIPPLSQQEAVERVNGSKPKPEWPKVGDTLELNFPIIKPDDEDRGDKVE